MNTIPLIPSDPNYEFSTTLNDVQFSFAIRWNSQDSAWYVDMADADDQLMVSGEKMVLGSFIGRKCTHPWFNDNVLMVVDTTLDELDAGLDDMGARIRFQHYTVLELVGALVVS